MIDIYAQASRLAAMTTPADLPLFVFGTLRDPLVLELVLGRDAASVPVT